MGAGRLDWTIVTCPWQANRFDVTTGQVMTGVRSVATYAVYVRRDDVLVDLPDDASLVQTERAGRGGEVVTGGHFSFGRSAARRVQDPAMRRIVRDYIATCIGRVKPQLEQHVARHFHYPKRPSPRSQPSAIPGPLAVSLPSTKITERDCYYGVRSHRGLSDNPTRKGGTEMAGIVKKSLRTPDEKRAFPKGKVELAKLGTITFGLATFEPGWKWSESVKPIAKTNSCQSPHTSYHVSGRLRVRMDDGTETEFGPGDVGVVPPGHDAWVVGNEPVVMLDITGMTEYAKQK